jgi:murein L,D-transpeptidase YcbB/YkuD
VIVGKASGKKIKFQGRVMGENQTPTLASVIEQVVFNPRWYITDRIIREFSEDIHDPAFLAKHGYVRMSSVYPSGDHRIFQMPGPTNPLGRVKFEFVNAYAVFLHDTPKKALFSRARRDFSHGCVRVEGALDLAKTLLADDLNPASSKADRLIESNSQTHVKLQQPVPIVIEYIPVVSNGSGQLIFCGDLYGIADESGQS